MKLISETIETPLSLIVEESEAGKPKRHIIEGVFMQAEKKNRNGRVYKKSVLERAVGDYMERAVRRGRAVGELDHPTGPNINLDKVSHRILNLEWDGNDVIGKALVLNTPCGQIVQGLLEGGVQLGVSSRGMGSLSQVEGVSYVGDDYYLNTVDIVQDPSAHDAFVNGIMEGVEWYVDREGNFKARNVKESVETERVISDKQKLMALEKFLSLRY